MPVVFILDIASISLLDLGHMKTGQTSKYIMFVDYSKV